MRLAWAAAAAVLMAGTAQAGEFEFMAGLGMNESSRNLLTLTAPNGATQDDWISWHGLSFEAPVYYDFALIYWSEAISDWGVGVEFNHAKAYADIPDSGVGGTYSHLEFTDGMNLLTANVFKKWDWNQARLYAGVGAGVSIPHVEVITTPGSIVGAHATWDYQLAGPAVQALVGASYEIIPSWRLFAEAKVSYAVNHATLNGGGTVDTSLVSTHLRAGISVAIDDHTGW